MYWHLRCVSWPPMGVGYFQVMLGTEGCWTPWTPKQGWSSFILKKFLGSAFTCLRSRRDRVAFVLSYNTPVTPSLHGFDHPFLFKSVSLWIHCWLAEQTRRAFYREDLRCLGKNLGTLRSLLPLGPPLFLFYFDGICPTPAITFRNFSLKWF